MSDKTEPRKPASGANSDAPDEGLADGSESPNVDAGRNSAADPESDAAKAGAARPKGEPAAESDPPGSTDGSDVEEKPEGAQGLLLWVLGILAILAVELFIYGRNGDIEICVGVEGVTDFALAGQDRTQENFQKFPMCAKRLNLGMWTSSDEQAKAALENACGRATVMRGAAHKQACIRKEKGWKRVVKKEHIPPWDSRLYRRLLWLD